MSLQTLSEEHSYIGYVGKKELSLKYKGLQTGLNFFSYKSVSYSYKPVTMTGEHILKGSNTSLKPFAAKILSPLPLMVQK